MQRVPLFQGVHESFVRCLVKLAVLEFYMPREYGAS
jgi:hypothetical protein